MRPVPLLVALLVLSPLCFADDIYVPDDHGTIQGAMDAAQDHDTIIVRPGTYYENIKFYNKEIVLKSEMGPEVTVIDGMQKLYVVIYPYNNKEDAVLDGFTITNGYASHGSGILIRGTSQTFKNNIIKNNIIKRNFGTRCGGGVYCSGISSTFVNNTIVENFSQDEGGGLYITGSDVTMINNTIANNRARHEEGGISINSSSSVVTMTNTILWENTAPVAPEGAVRSHSTLNISHSVVCGGISSFVVDSNATLNWGPTMLDADPEFTGFFHGDFHLAWNSPCRDKGDNTVVLDHPLDFENDPRIHDGTVDMGADEIHPHLYFKGGVIPGQSMEYRIIGTPSEPVILAQGSGIQDPPQPNMYGDLFLDWPIYQQSIGSLDADGYLIFQRTIPSHWLSGERYPFQALIGPQWFSTSVLTNLLVLSVE